MPGRVLVLDAALEDVGDGLEAAVRMIGRPHRLTGRVGDGTHLVDEKEGVDEVGAWRRNGAAHGEPSSLELPVRGDNARHFANGDGSAHGKLLLVRSK
jgi:hypothetical protein